ncbi:MAG: L-serine ammonia-lyase [Alphaproteobacteria bacterium]|nr:L-serine ammonia-lyase [Alphaproteobacteria bacterium]
MFLSVFDLFKIGIGPSSSHTMGPMVASNMFLDKLKAYALETNTIIVSVKVSLHGSLAFTGKGHATDVAVILGLCGEHPATIDLDTSADQLKRVYIQKIIEPDGYKAYRFDPTKDLMFDYKNELPGHPNGLRFEGLTAEDETVITQVYYSVGGGFVVTEEELLETENIDSSADMAESLKVPYPFATAAEMLEMANSSGLTIAEMKRLNEQCFMPDTDLDDRLDKIWKTMDDCIERGLKMDGVLEGGLNLKRRAKVLKSHLDNRSKKKQGPFNASDYLSLFAIAVNEENAAGGRIVTAPTNGAAGVIPAVIKYYIKFYAPTKIESIREFLLTAAAIGGLLKHNASISGAEVGCQGEVGSAAAMAAAGLACVLGGTPQQIENAAEIALEHHLGLTCDPVGGLVQVPCIERNAIGAVKAVAATSLALLGNGDHFVSLDACIATMKQTGMDMSTKYKETSQGGLAVNVINC